VIATACNPATSAADLTFRDSDDFELHYDGQITIAGRYYYDARGEFFLEPSRVSAKKFPLHTRGVTMEVGFSNDGAMRLALNVEREIDMLDLKKYCEVSGLVGIVVSEYATGEGPAHRWHTVKFDKLISSSKPSLIKCRTERGK
jgi:hypothetical protein